MTAWIALLLMVVAGVLLVFQDDAGSIAGFDPSEFASLVAGLALLIFIGGPLIGRYRGQLGTAARDLMIWLIAGLALIGGYAYRGELMSVASRITGELRPAGSPDVVEVEGEAAVRLRRAINGHFIATTEVNGRSMTLLVDTGASSVVLKPADAELAGIALDGLVFSVPVNTANGVTFSAPVRLKTVAVGPIVLEGVDALVAKPGTLSESLLGMSFLSRLRSYEFAGEYLTIKG